MKVYNGGGDQFIQLWSDFSATSGCCFLSGDNRIKYIEKEKPLMKRLGVTGSKKSRIFSNGKLY